MLARLPLTALKSNQYSGWATITHPFHPLQGKRFEIVSNKTFKNRDILSLKTSIQGTGTIAIPREWTDKADPELYVHSTSRLSVPCLQQLADLVNTLTKVPTKKRRKKIKKEVDI